MKLYSQQQQPTDRNPRACNMPSFVKTSRDILVMGLILISLVVSSNSVGNGQCECVNGGSCVNGSCICVKGYSGKHCEISIARYYGIDHVWLPNVQKIFQDKVGMNGIRPGRAFSLGCPAVNATGTYTTQWMLNNTLLDPAKDQRISVIQATGELMVNTPINQSYTRYKGVYQCRISNIFGTALGSRAQVKFKVVGSFINTNSTVTYNVTINNRLAIRCPDHTYSHGLFYRWINATSRRTINFPRPRVMTSQEDGTLYFTHVTADDVAATSNGIRCRITMDGEEVAPVAESGLVKMTKVKDNGAFQTTFFKIPLPVPVYFPVGRTREFECFPSGSSPLTMLWLKDSSPVSPNNIITLSNFNRTMRINNADRSVEGIYSYRTKNSIAERTISGMTIRIIFPAKLDHFLNNKETYNLDCTSSKELLNYPYIWYYNGVRMSILINSVFRERVFFHPNGTLTIKTAEPRDLGVYQCFVDGVAASHHYVYVLGAPLPPISLNTTDCSSFSTTLSWKVKDEPNIPVSSFIIEMGNTFEPNMFKQIKVVNEPNTRQIRLTELSPSANITFRMKAVNSLGRSLPSMLSNPCITSPAKPTSVPGELKAAPMKNSGEINVTWKSFPKIKWNGKKCVIRVYHKLHNISAFTLSPKNTSCSSTNIQLDKLGNYQLINIKIRVQNEVGMGPNSTIVTSYSGQNAPTLAPQSLRVMGVTPYSVTLKWDELVIQGGSIDHYEVTSFLGEQARPQRRRRSLSHPPSHDPVRLSMRVHGTTRNSRSGRQFSKNLFIANVRVSTKDKIRLFLAQVLWTLPGTRDKAKRILRRSRREVVPSGPSVLRVNVSNATVHGLLPFITYAFSVRGVNSGGAGPPSNPINQKTIDSVDSSYIITIVVTSEAFTPEYEDKTSLKYKNLSETLTTGIRRLPAFNQFWLRSLSVLSFRSGSVVSEVQMVAANPQLHSELRGVIVEVFEVDHFPNYVIDPSKTAILKELNFTRPNISVSDSSPYPGVTIEFECVTTAGPRSPVFSWFKDGNPLVYDVRHKFSSDDKKSILTIRKLTPNDKGNYTCFVSKGNQNATSSVLVNVLPVITIVPRALTKNEGDSGNFSCKVLSGDISGMVLLIIKPYPSQEVLGQNFFDVTNVRISSKNQTEVRTLQCILVKNNDIQSPVSKSPLATLTVVKPSFPKCLIEMKDKVTWSTTAVGKTDIHPCPGNATGQATRRCVQGPDSKPQWDEVNVGNCTSVVFRNLLLEAEAIVSDYKPSFNSSGLLKVLKNVTKARPKGLNGGDVDTTVRILSILVNNSKVDNTTDQDQQNVLEICSNILEPVNALPWIQFEDQKAKRNVTTLWNRLVVTVDEFGLQLANHMTTDNNKVFTTKNIAMRVDKVGLRNQIKKQGLNFQHEQSSLFLPAEIFRNPSDHRVVSLVYNTLNLVVRLQNTNKTQANNNNNNNRRVLIPSNTTIVTSTVRPEPTGKLENNVKITVENKQVVEPVPPRTCVYWRDGLPNTWKTDGCTLVPSESTKYVTTCQCDHLTIFASLMDPYGGPLPEEHRKALELISTIGCAISLFAILLTIVVMVFFWKALKGPRTIVLMNICVAIAVVCILVIAEGTARDTKVGCTIMAVLLHYFLLAVFCWMLCEGILLYLLIVKVIGAQVEEKVKWFLLFGWGFPALIVGICLGATQTHGYGYYGDQTACWLAVENGLIWAFVGPAILILMVNLVVLFLVLRQMMGTRHAQSKTRDVKIRMGVKATAVLLPLLGLTWLFGLLAFNSATLAFKYLFAIFNSLQGLMIFIFHCLLNKQVQDAVKMKYNKYSSTDSTASGTKIKNLQPIKKKFPSDYSQTAKVAPNEYEMYSQKRHSATGLIEKTGHPDSYEKVAALDKIALEDVDDIQIHRPKDDNSSINGHSIDEPPRSKVIEENQSNIELKLLQEVPLKSNIGSPNCIANVENDSVGSGLLNGGLESDDENPNEDQLKKGEEDKDPSDFKLDQYSLVVNAPDSPTSLSDADTTFNLTNTDWPTEGDDRNSPPPPSSISYEAVKPLAKHEDSNKPSREISDGFKKETPPSTPSSFDYGQPLNVSDDTLVMGSSGPSDDDDSVVSWSMNVGDSDQPEESGINSDDSSESRFDKYPTQADPNTRANVGESDSNETGEHVLDCDSDVSSSVNMEQFMKYDLILDIEDSETDGEKVVFKGYKKRDSITI